MGIHEHRRKQCFALLHPLLCLLSDPLRLTACETSIWWPFYRTPSHPIAALFCPASQLCYSECSSFSSSPRSCAWVCIVFYMSHGMSVGQKMAEKSTVPASWTGPPRACCIPWLPGEPKHNLLFASSSISQIILQDGPISFTFIKWQGYFYGSVDCEHPRHNYWWWGKCIMHEGILVFLWLQQCIHIPCI